MIFPHRHDKKDRPLNLALLLEKNIIVRACEFFGKFEKYFEIFYHELFTFGQKNRTFKGQLISKGHFCVLKSTKKNQRNILKDFCHSLFLAYTWTSWGPKLHPRGAFFWTMFFIILKNSDQDLSNEGSNFILSSLEVGHWVAQT